MPYDSLSEFLDDHGEDGFVRLPVYKKDHGPEVGKLLIPLQHLHYWGFPDSFFVLLGDMKALDGAEVATDAG